MTREIDYNKLAQRIVAQGVGSKRVDQDRYDWSNAWTDAWQKDRMCKTMPEHFCNDGRVVLALMEKVIDGEWIHDGEGWHASTMKPMSNIAFTGVDDSLPIAIELACLDALEEKP